MRASLSAVSINGSWTFMFVRDLAAPLRCTPNDLYIEQASAPNDAGAPDTIEAGDVARVGAVLAEFQSAAQIDTLAGALDWTLERTLIALEQLERLLEPPGNTSLGITTRTSNSASPHGGAHAAAAALTNATYANDGPDITEARLLGSLCEPASTRAHKQTTRLVVARLHAGGLIDLTPMAAGELASGLRNGDDPKLSELARYNLVLDD